MSEDMADFIIFVSMLASIGLIIIFIYWRCESKGPKMKYRDFRKFYALNPDRWYLCPSNVYCKTKDGDENFNFGFIDFWRYKFWFRSKKKGKRNAEYAKATQRMLDAVKQDVKSTKSVADTQIITALRETINSMKGLGLQDNNPLEELLKKIEELNNKRETLISERLNMEELTK